jgi:branched-chain amino acid transport system ATP-binding protein
MALLMIRKISKSFGGLNVLRLLDLDVFDSEIVGLIGPNGAGKTTLLNVISGFLRPTSGKVIFRNMEITGLEPDQVVRKGIVRTFQASTLFMGSSVFGNVFTACHANYRTGIWQAFVHSSAVRKEEEALKQKAVEILEFMNLASIKDEIAANLPHGHQRVLGICIALAANPQLLMLDEPATGMNPQETLVIVNLIRRIRDRGIAIIMVEHDMRAIMTVCDRVIVLNYGSKIAEGLPEEISTNKEVIEAYLGREDIWGNVV